MSVISYPYGISYPCFLPLEFCVPQKPNGRKPMNVSPSAFRLSVIHRRLFCPAVAATHPTPHVSLNKLAHCLENCLDIRSYRKIHARVIIHGFGGSTFIRLNLVDGYARRRCLSESKRFADSVIGHDVALCNFILATYFRTSYFDEVLRYYSLIKWKNVGIRASLVIYCLRSCSQLERLDFGKGIHVDALKCGLNINRFVGSSLIVFYARCRQIDGAYQVFAEIVDRDVVVYTSIITGYAQLGHYMAFEIAKCLHVDEIVPSRVTLLSLLQAAARLRAFREGSSVHAYALRRDIGSSDEVFETSIIDMYTKCGAPELAMVIFGRMSLRTSSTWNALITCYLHLGKPFAALHSFVLMVRDNTKPDLITLANGILSCSDLRSFLEGRSIHCYIIRQGFELDVVGTTVLICMYCKSKNLFQAKHLFDGMKERDLISFNVILTGFFENRCICEAMEIFRKMIKSRIWPNECTILALLSGLMNSRKGMAAHGFVIRHGFELSTEVANQLIYTYANLKNVHYAEHVFKRTMHKDLISWTSMIFCYVNDGRAADAIDSFMLMQREKIRPDSVILVHLCQAVAQLGCLSLMKEIHSYFWRVFESEEGTSPVLNSFITTYAKCGELDIACNIFKHAKGLCLTSWNAMIAAYGSHGHCMKAFDMFAKMQKQNLAPDATTFTSLLSACSHSGLVDEGLQIFKVMRENYGISPCEEHYYCVIDLLGRAGRLEDAAELVNHLSPDGNSDGLRSVLAACRIHGNIELGKVVGQKLLNLEPGNYSAYASLSNLCAEDEKWDLVASLRGLAKGRSLKITPGFTMI